MAEKAFAATGKTAEGIAHRGGGCCLLIDIQATP